MNPLHLGILNEMKNIVLAAKAGLALWTFIPVDHYTALGIAQSASNAEIDEAYRVILAHVSATKVSLALGTLFGQSPARLQVARLELLDPIARKIHDKHLKHLKIMFSHPPQC